MAMLQSVWLEALVSAKAGLKGSFSRELEKPSRPRGLEVEGLSCKTMDLLFWNRETDLPDVVRAVQTEEHVPEEGLESIVLDSRSAACLLP